VNENEENKENEEKKEREQVSRNEAKQEENESSSFSSFQDFASYKFTRLQARKFASLQEKNKKTRKFGAVSILFLFSPFITSCVRLLITYLSFLVIDLTTLLVIFVLLAQFVGRPNCWRENNVIL
jgi:flagellar biosynthesis protein FliP